jgi:hypothetical protein
MWVGGEDPRGVFMSQAVLLTFRIVATLACTAIQYSKTTITENEKEDKGTVFLSGKPDIGSPCFYKPLENTQNAQSGEAESITT